jgi:GntR family transcriptional regulator, transcriptional repressor for pyruvate dehydrogenase complex
MTAPAIEHATAALRTLIVRGRYQPGDRLPPERVLAEGLALSRPTLREAIRQLSEAGLLEARRGSGTYVAAIDLEALFAVRLQLEPFAARLAAARRTEARVTQLRTLLTRLRAQLDDPDAYAATDLELHAAIAEAADNAILLDTLRRLTDLAQVSRAVTSSRRSVRTATLRAVTRLVRAIRAGDETDAEDAMREHLETVRAGAREAARMHPRDRVLSALRPARAGE